MHRRCHTQICWSRRKDKVGLVFEVGLLFFVLFCLITAIVNRLAQIEVEIKRGGKC